MSDCLAYKNVNLFIFSQFCISNHFKIPMHAMEFQTFTLLHPNVSHLIYLYTEKKYEFHYGTSHDKHVKTKLSCGHNFASAKKIIASLY